MKIRELIKKSGRTRAEIIAQVGFSQGYLSLLESGERSVGQRYIVPLAEALGVSPSDLRPDWGALVSPSVNDPEGSCLNADQHGHPTATVQGAAE